MFLPIKPFGYFSTCPSLETLTSETIQSQDILNVNLRTPSHPCQQERRGDRLPPQGPHSIRMHKAEEDVSVLLASWLM